MTAARTQVWELAADRHAPHLAREQVRAFAADTVFPADRIGDVLLCVSETVTNAVLHALSTEEPAIVEIEAIREPHGLTVHVRDGATGRARRLDSPAAAFGMPIVAALTRSLEVRDAPGGGTEYVMRFSHD